MNKTLYLDGGMQFRTGAVSFDIDALTEAVNAIVKGLNNTQPLILFGCELSDDESGTFLSSGAVFYNGEIFMVDAASYSNKTVSDVSNYYFDLQESWDTKGLVPFFNNTVKNTRKIRKAILSIAASSFSNLRYDTITRINEVLQQQINANLANIEAHKANYSNHNFLVNHKTNGGTYDATPNIISDATLNTSANNYKSYFYIVGNLVFWHFCLSITITSGDSIVLEMPEWFARGNGYGQGFQDDITNINSEGTPLNTATLTPFYISTNSSGDARKIRFKNSNAVNFPAGSFTFCGSFTFKKLDNDSGYPAGIN